MTAPDTLVTLVDEGLTAALRFRANAETRRRIDLEDEQDKELIAKYLAEGETGADEDGTPLVRIQPGARNFDEAKARENLPADLVALCEVEETTTRIDEALAAQILTAEQLAAITVTTVTRRLDRTKAKDTLAPALYELACKQNRATIKPVLR
jgi:hypothetical protein